MDLVKSLLPIAFAAAVGLDPQALVVLASAIILAVLALRSQALRLYREERTAQRIARERAEKELAAARARVADLEALPDIERLYTLMAAHDERMSDLGDGLVASLRANTLVLQGIAETLGERP
jgi:hypothetical protein